jgi:hypothetical protein
MQACVGSSLTSVLGGWEPLGCFRNAVRTGCTMHGADRGRPINSSEPRAVDGLFHSVQPPVSARSTEPRRKALQDPRIVWHPTGTPRRASGRGLARAGTGIVSGGVPEERSGVAPQAALACRAIARSCRCCAMTRGTRRPVVQAAWLATASDGFAGTVAHGSGCRLGALA